MPPSRAAVGGVPESHAPVLDDARTGHLVRRHARRQSDGLLRTGRPGPGVGPRGEKKERRTNRGAYAKLTTMVEGRPRITEDPPDPDDHRDTEQAEIVDHLLAQYRLTLQEDRRSLFDRFTEVDTVRQVVGVGSVGMQVYLVLLEGRSGSRPLVPPGQAGRAVRLRGLLGPSRHDHHGARVINGKRQLQSATDIFVGWGSLHGREYYVRQFRDMKIIPTTDLIAPRLVEFATACGETLARAHAKAGRSGGHRQPIWARGPKFVAPWRIVRPPLRRPERAGPRPVGQGHGPGDVSGAPSPDPTASGAPHPGQLHARRPDGLLTDPGVGHARPCRTALGCSG